MSDWRCNSGHNFVPKETDIYNVLSIYCTRCGEVKDLRDQKVPITEKEKQTNV